MWHYRIRCISPSNMVLARTSSGHDAVAFLAGCSRLTATLCVSAFSRSTSVKLPKYKIPTYASMRIGPKFSQRFMRIWPPYLGAGIKPVDIAAAVSRTIGPRTPDSLTRNLVGNAFGGTMLSMTDPFFMFAGVYGLGKEYLVWDVGVDAKFIKPGRGKITADMQVS